MTELRTVRLFLRQWRPDDREPFAAMNADPEVMRHFPAALDRAGSDALAGYAQAHIAEHALAGYAQAHIAEHGWELWAVEAPDPAAAPPAAAFAGFIGLSAVGFHSHFTPAVEVGRRLAQPFRGQGYATEGARAALL